MTQNNTLLQSANELFPYTQDLRRDFHRHPELGFQEFRTAQKVAGELRALGLEVSTGIGQTGVVALIEGDQPGPVILLRFDMDALPIVEETGAEYASTQPGVMHACGHDGHTAIGLTVARLLNDHRAEICGKIKLLFQPAEEGQGGAEAVIKDGVLENPHVDAALGLHLWNEIPAGQAGIISGALMAGSDTFTITVTGKGGHGAMPERTIDPIVAAAQIITAIQSIPARSVSARSAAVISVTQVHAGTAFNIIPQTVEMAGTIRYFDSAVHALVLKRLQDVIAGIGAAMGCETKFEVNELTPAVINHPEMMRLVVEAAHNAAPDLEINENYQSMGSEDMAYLLERVPGCFFFVGSANAERGLNYAHHHPKFDIDESVLPTAVAWMSAAALNLGRTLQSK
jgi:amidohydrolase